MEALVTMLTTTTTEIIVILVGAALLVLAKKANDVLKQVKKKDELGILDLIADRAVAYAEAELKGEAGIKKRNFAVKKALKALEERGVKVSEDDVIAGIENGVKKLNESQTKTVRF